MELELRGFLASVLPFWESIGADWRARLEEAAQIKLFAKGTSLHSGDEDCSGLFVLMDGRVRVFIFSDTGKEITLYRLMERDICIFSASCILHNIRFEIYAEAERDTTAVLIPAKLFEQLMQTELSAADYASQLMASRFSDVMWVMEKVLFSSFDKRLANFLIEQANLEETERLKITHEEIARHLGSAREVVTRMLKYFQSEGLVELFRGGLEIKDFKRLRAFAED